MEGYPRVELMTVIGGSGGAGATTLVAYLAPALVRFDRKVVAIDADLGMGNLGEMLGTRAQLGVGDVISGRSTFREAMLTAWEGVRIVAAGAYPDPMRSLGPCEEIRLLEQIDAIAPEVDIVVVDAGRTPNMCFLAAVADRIVLVATPCRAMRRKAAETLKVVMAGRRRKTPVHILVNRSRSPEDGVRTFAEIAGLMDHTLCRELHFLGSFPFDAGLERWVQVPPDAPERVGIVTAAKAMAAKLVGSTLDPPPADRWGVFSV